MPIFDKPLNKPFYCVVGSPISHSLSPLIHESFGKAEGISLSYQRAEVSPGELSDALREFEAVGGRGLNLTVPLKEEVMALATDLAPRAELAGAGNTLTVKSPGHYRVDNTDGIGLVNDLTDNQAISLRDKRILVLGAGGAVRGVLFPLIECAPEIICIANRTVSKAQSLVEHFSSKALVKGVALSASGFDGLDGNRFDVIINGTSLGLQGKVPSIPAALFNELECCYDMMYHKSGNTAFTQHGAAAGARHVCDGLGMLVEQAAEAFSIWHGVRPNTESVIRKIRAM